MSGQNEPVIEDEMKTKLRGDTLKNALGFVAYVRASGLTNDDEYCNNFYYLNTPTFVLLCFENENYPEGEWGIYNSPIRDYEGIPLDEELKEFSRNNVRICTGQCGCPNWPRGGNQTVFGKEFKSVCSSVVMYPNPDAEALEKIKRIIEYWKLTIADAKNKGHEYCLVKT